VSNPTEQSIKICLSWNKWNHLDIKLCQHQTEMMSSNVQRIIAFLLPEMVYEFSGFKEETTFRITVCNC